MKQKKWIIFLLVLAVIGAIAFFVWRFNDSPQVASENQNSSYAANKTSASSAENQTNSDTKQEAKEQNQAENQNSTAPQPAEENSNPEANQAPAPSIREQQLATFTTKIYTKDSSRQTNIDITSKKLNGTVVKNGATFSFCQTIGPSTTQKGYQKADIYDNEGKKKKGLGGGNCQISTTLYNAVLAAPSLTVTERHEHSNYVPYIQEGKDAAVAYGSYDLKFKNNSGNDLRIDAQSTNSAITINLISLIPES